MLYIHRSERADHLVRALGDLLLEPGPDPMVAEVVAVPTRGVERWLTQRLSHRLGAHGAEEGVCANVEFPFPGALVGAVTALGCEFAPEEDPWPPERSVWPLIRVIDAHLDHEFLAPLAAHLRASAPQEPDGRPRLRRFATARHLADLFDRYSVHRPDMIEAWAEGRTMTSVPDQEVWQAELWRRLREEIACPSPAERFGPAIARLRSDAQALDLPGRLSLFGLTRLPVSHVRVLSALAEERDVHLYLLHPSAVLWDALAPTAAGWSDGRRSADPSAGAASHPLLRSWGRDAREMQLVVAGAGPFGGGHLGPQVAEPSLLGRIQADIRLDQAPPGAGPFGPGADPRPVLGSDDRTITVHACHGRTRQVEVLRDAVLHLLEDDPTLELRDVVVMCPDIEAFAPLIQSAFGAGDPALAPGGAASDPSELPGIPVRLADRALRQTNPLLAVASRLLDLAGARVSASQVFDLLSMEAVARRFELNEDGLARLQSWVAEAGIRWGMDGEARAAFGLAGVEDNTWSVGMQRLVLGVAMAEEDGRLFGGVLPVDDLGGGETELLGRLAEMVSRLGRALHSLGRPMPGAEWSWVLGEATRMLARAEPGEEWQNEQLERVLGDVALEASARDAPGEPVALDLGEVRSLLSVRLAGRPTRANFRTGDLTVCTLVPMRSVPHRVVCLLGLDDDVFPRHGGEDGDDLLTADPHVGDRDPRSEDRQLLLDAFLAATEKLVITYSGRDPRTNQPRPPAVPVAELLDVIDRTVRHSEPGRRGRDQVVVQHPLQPFDHRNFVAGGLGRPGPWSFDPVNRRGALARRGERGQGEPWLEHPLDPLARPVLELAGLIRFVEAPVKAFLRERLGLYLGGGDEGLDDSVPLAPGPLARWGVGDRLLTARLAGLDPERAAAAERARGTLPPGAPGEDLLAEIAPWVEAILEVLHREPFGHQAAESYDVNLTLPDGRALVGTVPGVRDGVVVSCTYSSLGAKHRLGTWVRFLALGAARPDLEVGALSLGRAGTTRRPRVGQCRLAPLPGPPNRREARALELLTRLVDLYDRGMREPLPLYCRTSHAWVQAERAWAEPDRLAADQWKSRYAGPPGEDREPEHVRVLGGEVPFAQLCGPRRQPDDPPGPEGIGPSRFELFAHLLWDDLLDHEAAVGR